MIIIALTIQKRFWLNECGDERVTASLVVVADFSCQPLLIQWNVHSTIDIRVCITIINQRLLTEALAECWMYILNSVWHVCLHDFARKHMKYLYLSLYALFFTHKRFVSHKFQFFFSSLICSALSLLFSVIAVPRKFCQIMRHDVRIQTINYEYGWHDRIRHKQINIGCSMWWNSFDFKGLILIVVCVPVICKIFLQVQWRETYGAATTDDTFTQIKDDARTFELLSLFLFVICACIFLS